jgi:hypothetical protein
LTWKATRVIQSGCDGVNVVAELRRTGSDGRQVAASSALFLATNLHTDQWGVIGTSVIPH